MEYLVLLMLFAVATIWGLSSVWTNNRDKLISKLIATAAILLCPMVICLIAIGEQRQGPPEKSVFITAAHIPETEYPESKRVYVDEENDRAVYVNIDYEPSHVPDGSHVTFGDKLRGKVAYSSGLQMYVDVANSDAIIKGLSGTDVLYNGKVIGFVSSLVDNGQLLCIYL